MATNKYKVTTFVIVCRYRFISIKHYLQPEKYNQKHLTFILGSLSLIKQITQGAIKKVGYWALHIEVEQHFRFLQYDSGNEGP